MLGKASGRHIHALAHNRDPRPVQVGRRRRSIGSQRAMGRGPWSWETLDATLVGICDRLGRRLRTARRVFRTRRPAAALRRLHPRDALAHAARGDDAHRGDPRSPPAGCSPRRAHEIRRRGITLLGLSLTNLQDASAIQLVLPLDRRRALDSALDDVRERYGTAAITRAVLLGRDPGFSVPLLPD